MQAVVDGLMTSYERRGRGRSVLILPGWADAAANWRKFSAKLAESYDVLTLDLPGFGGSEAPKTAWDLTDYANFVADFLKKVNFNPAAIIGHSNGGAIVLRGVGTGKLTPEKLILLASAGIRNQYNGRTKSLRMLTKAGKALTAPLPKNVKDKLKKKVYKTAGSDMLVAEHMQPTFKKIITDDVLTDAAKVNTPTLLVYGEADDQTPVRYGELFHEKIDGSTLEILPGAGHFLYLEQQSEIINSIKGFLK